MSKQPADAAKVIAENRKARHDYFIEETYEAGVVLEGWEAKSLRDNRLQLKESHVIVRKGEAWLLNAHISPLDTVSTHFVPNPTRPRKLLLHKREIHKLMGRVEERGFTVVPLKMIWRKQFAKLVIALAKGKHLHDKRASIKERDWQRQKAQVLKKNLS